MEGDWRSGDDVPGRNGHPAFGCFNSPSDECVVRESTDCCEQAAWIPATDDIAESERVSVCQRTIQRTAERAWRNHRAKPPKQSFRSFGGLYGSGDGDLCGRADTRAAILTDHGAAVCSDWSDGRRGRGSSWSLEE